MIPELETHVLACRETPVENPRPGVWMAGGAMLPLSFIEAIEQDQRLSHCCRHPERNTVAAFYSGDRERELGVPDIYVFHCSCCGRCQRRWCLSPSETAGIIRECTHPEFSSAMAETTRPIWE